MAENGRPPVNSKTSTRWRDIIPFSQPSKELTMKSRFIALCIGLLLSSLALGQTTTTVQVPVPAKQYSVPVPAITPPPVVLSIAGQSVSIPVPALTPPAVSFTAPAYTVSYTTAVSSAPPPATCKASMIGSNAPAGSPSSIIVGSDQFTVVGGVIQKNAAVFGVSGGVVLLAYNCTTFEQVNNQCQMWSAADAISWASATAAISGITLPKCTPATGTGGTTTGTTSPPVTGLAIKVSGKNLVNGSGVVVQLRGVNVSGLEAVAIDGWDPSNPWGSQTGDATPNFALMKSAWGVNAVRLPLNEDSWLGLSCADLGGNSSTIVNGAQVQDKPGQVIQADPGGNYQATALAAVAAANAAGLYVILDLHWAAPNVNGTPTCPTAQTAMADTDHSIAFWTSLATAFKGNPAVMFELFNEPYMGETARSDNNVPGADILNGNPSMTAFIVGGNPSVITANWAAAGMQAMLNAVRATGATNVVLVSDDNWTQEMTDWLTYKPTDSAGQLAAAWHPYANSNYPTQVSCINLPSCSALQYAAVQAVLAAGFPVVATEFGDNTTSSPSATAPWVSVLLPMADKWGISYLGWTWDVWGNIANVLITDEAGDPTYGYGTYVKQHYLCRAAGTATCQ